MAASGGLLLAHGAGAAAGPLIAGFAMSATPRGLSYTLVAAQVLIVLFGVSRLFARAPLPVAHKSAFALEPPVPVGDRVRRGPFAADVAFGLRRQRALHRSDPYPELLRPAQKIDADGAVDLVGVERAHEVADARHRLAVEGDDQIAGQ